ncbi:hypothetical protein ACQE98_09775 [Ornithinimicrobium sp. W1679]|uniref:hypothetical protein n=1 Tax=Ornithinimicrobium sp. W1679 TaxID=3418770 RepID=UPI003CF611CD
MRTTARTLTAALLAAPLVAGSVLPASAGEAGHVRSSGTFASIDLTGPETSDAIPGNYLAFGSLEIFGDWAMGGAVAFQCEDGATPDDAEGCTYVADVWFDGGDLDVSTGKGKNATTAVVGDLSMYTVSWDEETSEGNETATIVPLDVSLTPYGKSSRETQTYTFRDGETGESFSFRATRTASRATVSGDLGDLSLDGKAGYTGSYRSQDRWRMP